MPITREAAAVDFSQHFDVPSRMYLHGYWGTFYPDMDYESYPKPYGDLYDMGVADAEGTKIAEKEDRAKEVWERAKRDMLVKPAILFLPWSL